MRGVHLNRTIDHHKQRSIIALHCYKAHAQAQIKRKMGNSTRCKIVTPKNFILKLCTRDYVRASGRLLFKQILVSIGTVGASPHISEILPLCDFCLLSYSVLSYLFLDPASRSNRWTEFDAL